MRVHSKEELDKVLFDEMLPALVEAGKHVGASYTEESLRHDLGVLFMTGVMSGELESSGIEPTIVIDKESGNVGVALEFGVNDKITRFL